VEDAANFMRISGKIIIVPFIHIDILSMRLWLTVTTGYRISPHGLPACVTVAGKARWLWVKHAHDGNVRNYVA
jgi:hypothetical protein